MNRVSGGAACRAYKVLAFAALAVACTPPRRVPSCDAECADRAAVMAAIDRYAHALTLVNADSVTAYFTDDGALVQAGQAPIVGRGAIHAFLAPFDGRVIVERQVIGTDSMRRVDGAMRAWGTFEQVAGPRGGTMQTSNGGYVADFVRGAGSAGDGGSSAAWRSLAHRALREPPSRRAHADLRHRPHHPRQFRP